MRGAALFRKINVPVLGLLENMSYHVCASCGARSHIFGEDGGKRLAHAQHMELLGQVLSAPGLRGAGSRQSMTVMWHLIVDSACASCSQLACLERVSGRCASADHEACPRPAFISAASPMGGIDPHVLLCAQIPLHVDVRTCSDEGSPIVARDVQAPAAQAYKQAAHQVWELVQIAKPQAPTIRTQ